jgi:hypothetical protein
VLERVREESGGNVYRRAEQGMGGPAPKYYEQPPEKLFIQVNCVAKRGIGKLKANSPGALVLSGLSHSPCRLLFQNDELGLFLYPAGVLETVAEVGF